MNYTNSVYHENSINLDLYDLGYNYQRGIGVEKDEHKAFNYYQKSAKMAEMRHADGMYYAGEFYRQGIVVEKNMDIAFEWYLKSATTEQNTQKEEFFHWIPYDKFENIEEIGKGGFSTVFRTKYLN
ncbi:HCP-like protein [Gigaspora margarita]|uniref:HCP-like protein n=1 Tax=Gigaspora margarita TaxID=4874 RepID=A0A8H4A9D8_GIGMA|nr:HCP-like protein [Gigaspora margarita]